MVLKSFRGLPLAVPTVTKKGLEGSAGGTDHVYFSIRELVMWGVILKKFIELCAVIFVLFWMCVML